MLYSQTVAEGTDPLHEVAFLFPPMSEEDYQDLREDIRTNGLVEPIWRSQGRIIDGRHRSRACRELGIAPTFREWDGQGSLVAFVVRCNLKRRHLTVSQRAMLALEIAHHLAFEAKERQRSQGWHGKEGGRGHRKMEEETLRPHVAEGFGETAYQAGQIVGVGKTTVKKAKRIVTQVPELSGIIMAGTLNLEEAQVVAPLVAEERAVIIAQVTSGKAKTAKAAVLDLKKGALAAQIRSEPGKPQLVHASWDSWLPAQPSCDLLLTDPPYSTDIQDIVSFAHTWLPQALDKVKASGRAYVYIEAYPRELQAYLHVPVPEHLQLLNILVWTYRNTIGPVPKHAYKQNWQAILYYAGVEAPPLDCPLLLEQFSVQDINAPDGRLGERYHAWQKPDELAARLIRHSTQPGAVVLDCFAGTGTFLLAAQRLGRVALGCEVSETMLALAEERGCEVARGCLERESSERTRFCADCVARPSALLSGSSVRRAVSNRRRRSTGGFPSFRFGCSCRY